MSVFDWLDYAIITALFAVSFWFGGSRWRWHVSVGFLAAHLVVARFLLHLFESPVQALALVHAGFALLLLAYSQTNYGRAVGLCFLIMLALDGLAIAGIVSAEIKLGLHLNFWNGISALQHVQAIALATCFYKSRRMAWVLV